MKAALLVILFSIYSIFSTCAHPVLAVTGDSTDTTAHATASSDTVVIDDNEVVEADPDLVEKMLKESGALKTPLKHKVAQRLHGEGATDIISRDVKDVVEYGTFFVLAAPVWYGLKAYDASKRLANKTGNFIIGDENTRRSQTYHALKHGAVETGSTLKTVLNLGNGTLAERLEEKRIRSMLSPFEVKQRIRKQKEAKELKFPEPVQINIDRTNSADKIPAAAHHGAPVATSTAIPVIVNGPPSPFSDILKEGHIDQANVLSDSGTDRLLKSLADQPLRPLDPDTDSHTKRSLESLADQPLRPLDGIKDTSVFAAKADSAERKFIFSGLSEKQLNQVLSENSGEVMEIRRTTDMSNGIFDAALEQKDRDSRMAELENSLESIEIFEVRKHLTSNIDKVFGFLQRKLDPNAYFQSDADKLVTIQVGTGKFAAKTLYTGVISISRSAGEVYLSNFTDGNGNVFDFADQDGNATETGVYTFEELNIPQVRVRLNASKCAKAVK